MENLYTILKTEEKERKRISNELHDIVGARMTVLKMKLEHCAFTTCANTYHYTGIIENLDLIIDQIREISYNLMPKNIQKQGLKNVLQEIINEINHNTNLEIDYFNSGLEEEIDDIFSFIIYRTVNELITNVFKHSKATKCIINIYKKRNIIQITFEDNGIGFKDNLTKGLGLFEIKKYIKKNKGIFEIQSIENVGTSITIEFKMTELR
jgi:two-component system NarL family sensor kinase